MDHCATNALNVHWFETLGDANEKIEAWRVGYYESRPCRSLNCIASSWIRRVL